MTRQNNTDSETGCTNATDASGANRASGNPPSRKGDRLAAFALFAASFLPAMLVIVRDHLTGAKGTVDGTGPANEGGAGSDAPPDEDWRTAGEREQRARQHRKVRAFSVIVFGAMLPAVLLALSAYSLFMLQEDFKPDRAEFQQKLDGMQRIVNQNRDNDAYAFVSFVFAEHSNFAVLHDKQRMKVATMQLGFAVASLGIMFILLGVNDGGVEGKVEHTAANVDFKIASTGVATFVIGAAMSYGAGILKNDYKTVDVPMYGSAPASPDGDMREFLTAVVKDCKGGAKEQLGNCLATSLVAQLAPYPKVAKAASDAKADAPPANRVASEPREVK